MGHSLPALPTVYSPGAFGFGSHIVYYNDFLAGGVGTSATGGANLVSTTADMAEWLATVDNAGSNVIIDGTAGVGGVLRITPGTSAADFRSLQLNGESFAVRNNKKMWFGARYAISDADDGPSFVGMCCTDITGTTLGPISDGATTDSIGFRTSSTSAVLNYVVEDDTNETAATTGTTLVDATYVEVGFFLNGRSYIEMFVNGARVYKGASNIPDNDAPLTPSVEIGSTTGTTATFLDLDWIYAIYER